MRAGDVLGHEFMGTVVEVGPAVTKHQVGDRVVVVSFTSCGKCWYCRQGLWSLCDNGNPNPGITEALWGQAIGGCYGYSHALGGWAGSHAPYIRVPYADQGAFAIPGDVSDERALFASDAAPTGWTGAHQAGVQAGDLVAVWGARAHANQQLARLREDALDDARSRSDHLRVGLDSSRTIGTAIGILMTNHRLTAATAFRLLTAASQQTNRKLRDIAADVVTTGQLPVRPTLADDLLTRVATTPDRS